MAWQIVRHAFLMVFRNLGAALRASLVPLVVLWAVGSLILAQAGIDLSEIGHMMAAGGTEPNMPAETPVEPMTGPQAGAAILSLSAVFMLLLGYAFVVSWIGVAWHRYILLEVEPGWIPIVPLSAVLNTFGMLVLLTGGGTFAISLAGAFLSIVSPVPGLAVLIVGMFAMVFVWFRLGLIFPSIAIGKPLDFSEAWFETEPYKPVIFGIIALLFLLNIGASLLTGMLSVLPFLGLAVNIGLMWAFMLGGMSILTTLYGVLVEKRALP